MLGALLQRRLAPTIVRRQPVRRGSAGAKEDLGDYLFGEKPIAGQARQWQSWEMPYYVSMTGAALLLIFGLGAKPDTDLRTWARIKALELSEEEE